MREKRPGMANLKNVHRADAGFEEESYEHLRVTHFKTIAWFIFPFLEYKFWEAHFSSQYSFAMMQQRRTSWWINELVCVRNWGLC